MNDMPGCHDLRYTYLFDAPAGYVITVGDRARYELAAVLCATCPVLEQCATDRTVQMSEGFRHGVLFTWGKKKKPIARRLAPTKGPRPHIDREERRCPRCGETKPLAEYSRDTYQPDGHDTYCKTCRIERRRLAAKRPRPKLIRPEKAA
jgi:hypothetical protein